MRKHLVILLCCLGALAGCSDSADDDVVVGWTERKVEYSVAGEVCAYEQTDINACGNREFESQFSGAGDDCEWFTADDVVQEMHRYVYASAGYVIMEFTYSGPGKDGRVNTDDDVVSSYSRSGVDGNGGYVYTEFVSSGADGRWLSADDVPGVCRTRVMAEDELSARSTMYSGPGTDGVYGTDDDEVESYSADRLDSWKRCIRTDNYDAAGNDGDWFTGDDVLWGYDCTDYGENGRRKFCTHFRAGKDGEWDTDDDRDWGTLSRLNAAGRTVWKANFTAGADGEYDTPDDVWRCYDTYEFDSLGRYRGEVSYDGCGVDGKWDTDDDSVRAYRDSMFDDLNRTVVRTNFGAPGIDARWFTADDSIRLRLEGHWDASGNLLSEKVWCNPGVDGKWGTVDDALSQEKYRL